MRPLALELAKDETSIPSDYDIRIVHRLRGETPVTTLQISFQKQAVTEVIMATDENVFDVGARYGGILDDIDIVYSRVNTPRLILRDNGHGMIAEIFPADDPGGYKTKQSFANAVAGWILKEAAHPRLPRSERTVRQALSA